MDILSIIFWPFIIFAFFVVFASLPNSDVDLTPLISFALFIYLVYFLLRNKKKDGAVSVEEHNTSQAETLRRNLIIFAIALLLPLFVRFFYETLSKYSPELFAITIAIVASYTLGIWGIFVKRNKVLMYGNIIGAGIALLYCYIQIWSLGDIARVAASAVGLGVAIVVSIVKFKENNIL